MCSHVYHAHHCTHSHIITLSPLPLSHIRALTHSMPPSYSRALSHYVYCQPSNLVYIFSVNLSFRDTHILPRTSLGMRLPKVIAWLPNVRVTPICRMAFLWVTFESRLQMRITFIFLFPLHCDEPSASIPLRPFKPIDTLGFGLPSLNPYFTFA